MADYVITCCSTVDLSEDLLKTGGINYIPFTFHLDGKDYDDDYGKSYEIHRFYDAMRKGSIPTTSQVGTGRYEEEWRSLLAKGLNVLHITLSSGISGTYNSALLAADLLNEEFQDVRVEVVDSLCASSGYGMLVMMANAKRLEGMGFSDNLEWVKANRLYIHHWFFPSVLTYLVKGGRVSKISGMIGDTLHICPLMNVDQKGRLIPRAKIRGKRKVMQAQVEKMIEHAENGLDYDGKVYICNSDCLDDVEYLKNRILATFKKVKQVEVFNIGTVIGSHTGPGTIGLFFKGDKRVD